MCSQHGDSTQAAIRVFAHYLRVLDAGEAVDFEALCTEHPSLASRLRDVLERWRTMVSRLGRPGWHPDDVEVRLLELFDPEHGDTVPGMEGLTENMDRLRRRGWDKTRFDERGEVARGAMGRIQRVWDRELRRSLAKKVLLERRSKSPDAAHESTVRLARFLEEAQITAQLDHPGIVPVHDLGVDEDGNAFFTMRLVRGEDLRSVFEKVAKGVDGWTLTRVLGVLVKLCEALAFAHSKGVVHRDLKPANVMIGRFGEVYAMDWGLARVMDRPDSRDLRVQHSPQSQSMELSTARTDTESSHGSPLRTMDGHVVGTPAYMPPEQARGELELLGPRSDVYAVGAMLYHLLSGHMPYLEEGSPTSPYEIWAQVRERPPKSIRSIARDKPPELVAICEKAMARDPRQRYADVRELREDLQRFLENRVVLAYRTGPRAEAQMWARRNPLVAGSAVALVIVTVAAAFLVAVKEAGRRQTERRALDEYLAADLVRRGDELWPIHPAEVPHLEAWLAEAVAFVRALPEYALELDRARHAGTPVPVSDDDLRIAEARQTIDELQRRLDALSEIDAKTRRRLEVEPPDSARALEDRRIVAIYSAELPRMRREIERQELIAQAVDEYGFSTFEERREHDRLQSLVAHMRTLEQPQDGLIKDVRTRLELARALVRRSIDEHSTAWSKARMDISDPLACPLYEGLDLAPQLGLVPLRRDPDSGLWEFWHVLSGEQPQPNPGGGWVITPESGIVMVLVPGGLLVLGCEEESLKRPGDYVFKDELREHELELSPYFLSKYELTQGQWLRLARINCGEMWAGSFVGQDPMIDLTHPVQGLEWKRTQGLLTHWGLRMPTEAQWEHAALAGRVAASEWRTTPLELTVVANLFHDNEQEDSKIPKPFVSWSRHAGDTYIWHSPVGFYPPNEWGFHDMIGNVEEWCRDGYLESGYEQKNTDGDYELLPVDPRTGEHFPRASRNHALRGSSFKKLPSEFRLSARHGWDQDVPAPEGGVRTSMDIQPEWKPVK